jgi:hypothetical protein
MSIALLICVSGSLEDVILLLDSRDAAMLYVVGCQDTKLTGPLLSRGVWGRGRARLNEVLRSVEGWSMKGMCVVVILQSTEALLKDCLTAIVGEIEVEIWLRSESMMGDEMRLSVLQCL